MPITKHTHTNLLRDERRLAANRLAYDPWSLQDRRKELEPHVSQIVPRQASSAPGVPDPLPLLVVLGNAPVSLVRVVLGTEIDETPKQVQEPVIDRFGRCWLVCFGISGGDWSKR